MKAPWHLSQSINRPVKPTNFDHTSESYYQHNKYFNEAEKIFDDIDRLLLKKPDLGTRGVFLDYRRFPFIVRNWFRQLLSINNHKRRKTT